jgi:hypothetical protein
MPVIGVLHSQSSDAFSEAIRGFREGLRRLGYVEGQSAQLTPEQIQAVRERIVTDRRRGT